MMYSPIPYPGGKSKAIPLLRAYTPSHSNYVEVFGILVTKNGFILCPVLEKAKSAEWDKNCFYPILPLTFRCLLRSNAHILFLPEPQLIPSHAIRQGHVIS